MRLQDTLVAVLIVAAAGLGWLGWQQLQVQKRQADALAAQAPVLAKFGTALDQAGRWLEDSRRAVANPEPEEIPPLAAALSLLHHGNPEIRANAVQILAKIGGDEAEKAMLEVVTGADSNLRQAALYALRQMGSKKANGIILEWLKNGTPEQANTAAGALSNGGGLPKDMVAPILEILKGLSGDDNSRNLRSNLCGALQQAGDPRVCEVLADLIQDETEEYARRNMAGAMLRNATRKEFPLVAKTFELTAGPNLDTDSGSVAQFLQYFGSSRNFRATAYVLPYLKSKSNYLQRSAVQAAIRLRDPAAAKALAALAGDLKDASSRSELETAVRAGNLPGLKMVDDKITLVPDEELTRLLAERKKALE